MRIIAGKRKGMQLKAPAGMLTRPTTDRVKENIFNLIQMNIRNRTVLDLFAGTGGMGIEAMSRGAKEAIFVEKDRHAYEVLCENLHKVDDLCPYDVFCLDSLLYLQKAQIQFDLIFLDPPYSKGLLEPSLTFLCKRGLVAKDGFVVIETSKDDIYSYASLPVMSSLTEIKNIIYGQTRILIYHRK